MKRTVDIILAIVGLVIGAPLMALIAIAIKLDSPGRVFFSQERLGKHGKIFRMHKFRKFPDAWGNQGSGVTVAGDARMTRLGRLLERSKFDELPQLWNILKGEMSFVGPRPESLHFANLFRGELARVHDFTPGIFGPNQVAYRNESAMYPPERNPEDFYREELFPQKARNDIEYFSRANLLSDLGWIVRGVWCSLVEAVNWKELIRQRGAHVAYDLFAVQAAWLGANLIRFEGLPRGSHWDAFVSGFWLFPLIVLPVLFLGAGYRQPVRHFTFRGVLRVAATNIVGFTIAFMIMLALVNRSISLMLGPMVIMLSFLLMTGARLYYRERWRRQKRDSNGQANDVRIAIYGAGRRGGTLASLFEQGFPDSELTGFFDDNDARMRGREINGRKVLGSERDLDTVHAVHGFNQLWLTFTPDQHKRRRLQRWCSDNKVNLIILPETAPFTALLPVERSVEQTNRSELPEAEALRETAGLSS